MKKYLLKVATDQIDGGMVPVVRALLFFCSIIYRAILSVRMALYKTGLFEHQHVGRPVISVGNLTVGGTGKTPLVELICRHLVGRHIQPAVLIRGYMEKAKQGSVESSDEARMLQDHLCDVPILVGSNRIESATLYLKEHHVDLFVLDDGFQHWPIKRDLDIVLVDSVNPWGNRCVLPRGILREPMKALARAHIFVLTKTDQGSQNVATIKNDLKSINPSAPVIESLHRVTGCFDLRSNDSIGLETFNAQNVCAVSSIGSPESFKGTLCSLGVDLKGHMAYVDHHMYIEKDIHCIVKNCEQIGVTRVMTTEKDAVKLKKFLKIIPINIEMLVVRVELVITDGKDDFFERIDRVL